MLDWELGLPRNEAISVGKFGGCGSQKDEAIRVTTTRSPLSRKSDIEVMRRGKEVLDFIGSWE